MGGHTFPELHCTICFDPVDLSIDLCADETGQPVHEGCYVSRLLSARTTLAKREIMNRSVGYLCRRRVLIARIPAASFLYFNPSRSHRYVRSLCGPGDQDGKKRF